MPYSDPYSIGLSDYESSPEVEAKAEQGDIKIEDEDLVLRYPGTPEEELYRPRSLSRSDSEETIVVDEVEDALRELIGAEDIPLNIGLEFFPPEVVDHLYGRELVPWQRREESEERIWGTGFGLGTRGSPSPARYRTPTPYPRPAERRTRPVARPPRYERPEQEDDRGYFVILNSLRGRNLLRSQTKYPHNPRTKRL